VKKREKHVTEKRMPPPPQAGYRQEIFFWDFGKFFSSLRCVEIAKKKFLVYGPPGG
jgi:hypothetical protein